MQPRLSLNLGLKKTPNNKSLVLLQTLIPKPGVCWGSGRLCHLCLTFQHMAGALPPLVTAGVHPDALQLFQFKSETTGLSKGCIAPGGGGRAPGTPGSNVDP